MNTAFITTSIPYVNDRPHVGFALELVLADAAARWRRLRGDEVFLLSGTDENALKNVEAAARQGLTPQELCDRNAVAFQDLIRALGISTDGFIRTSSPRHHQGAARFWNACRKEDLVLRHYRGRYCTGCEDFYLERDLQNGRCPVHGTETETVEEENYFFRLSAYRKPVEDLLASGRLRIFPETRCNEALAFVRGGLRDFSVSRLRARAGAWGVPVPGDPTQVLYVWFDALVNYLTGLGYGADEGLFERYWKNGRLRLHVIGKDILKFHAVYWPALLLAAGLPLPDALLVHGHLTVDGRKISKSLGNAVDPIPLVERYGADALRYHLLRAVPAGADGDFSETRLRDLYTADLAHGLGNLVRRLETLCERAAFVARGPAPAELPDEICGPADAFHFDRALGLLWDRVRDLNRDIEAARPWDLLKQDGGGRLDGLLSNWVRKLRVLSRGLSPFLPETAAGIEAAFSKPRILRGPPLFPQIS